VKNEFDQWQKELMTIDDKLTVSGVVMFRFWAVMDAGIP